MLQSVAVRRQNDRDRIASCFFQRPIRVAAASDLAAQLPTSLSPFTQRQHASLSYPKLLGKRRLDVDISRRRPVGVARHLLSSLQSEIRNPRSEISSVFCLLSSVLRPPPATRRRSV